MAKWNTRRSSSDIEVPFHKLLVSAALTGRFGGVRIKKTWKGAEFRGKPSSDTGRHSLSETHGRERIRILAEAWEMDTLGK